MARSISQVCRIGQSGLIVRSMCRSKHRSALSQHDPTVVGGSGRTPVMISLVGLHQSSGARRNIRARRMTSMSAAARDRNPEPLRAQLELQPPCRARLARRGGIGRCAGWSKDRTDDSSRDIARAPARMCGWPTSRCALTASRTHQARPVVVGVVGHDHGPALLTGLPRAP